MTERLDWFPCDPGKLLGALAGMRAPKAYVYTIVLLRIYESGGACADGLDALATRTRLNKRIVADALAELFSEGRIYRADDGAIHNGKADSVIAESHALRERRKTAGAEAANRRWQKTDKNQGKPHSKANAKPMRSDAHLQLQLQEESSLFTDVNRAKGEESAVMPDPPPDPEADYYRRGREVLGANGGGVLTQLLRAKGGNLALARAAIEHASTRGDARQYVGAMVRNFKNGGSDGKTTSGLGGYSGLAARLRQTIADEERDFGGSAAGGEQDHRR